MKSHIRQYIWKDRCQYADTFVPACGFGHRLQIMLRLILKVLDQAISLDNTQWLGCHVRLGSVVHRGRVRLTADQPPTTLQMSPDLLQ